MERTLTQIINELPVTEQKIIRAKADAKITDMLKQVLDNQKEDTQSKNTDTK
jgi:hypothetical protein